MFINSWVDRAFETTFTPPPPGHIWEWAEENVWLDNQEAAEPGFYRSAKTPWTRRIQELIRNPIAYFWSESQEKYVPVLVNEINEEKSSQSGVTEGVLNGIRWRARYEPCNVLYQIDSQKEAQTIRDRLLPSLEKLDGNIFTGDEADTKALVLKLRAMTMWFIGAGSSGQAANKQTPFVVCDEVEEHGQEKGDTDTLTNADSRRKTAKEGLQINISKPKLKSGPIHKAFLEGNQEEFHITCPHCRQLQWLTFFLEEREVPFSDKLIEVRDEQTGAVVAELWRPLPIGETRTVQTGRMVFEHCKNRLGQWDRLRILSETYYECAACAAHVVEYERLSKLGGDFDAAQAYYAKHQASIDSRGRIDEWRKGELVANAKWLPTAHGTPGIVSQHISDLYSSDAGSSWGNLVLRFLRANRGGRTKLQGFYNHRLGLAFADEANETTSKDILANIAGRQGDTCPAYRKGEIPFEPRALVLDADIGGNYAKWALGAVAMNGEDVAIFDWGEEIDPFEIAEIIRTQRWYCAALKKEVSITIGFMDGKYRKTDALNACLQLPRGKLIPTAGNGGEAARGIKVWSFHQIPTYPKGFCQLTYNDVEAKDELYIERFKKKKRRVFFPVDIVDEKHKQFVAELCAEVKAPDKNGENRWNPHPPPNHWGDCVKGIVTGLRFLTRNDRRELTSSEAPPVAPEPSVALPA
jgi:hypothetical protein